MGYLEILGILLATALVPIAAFVYLVLTTRPERPQLEAPDREAA